MPAHCEAKPFSAALKPVKRIARGLRSTNVACPLAALHSMLEQFFSAIGVPRKKATALLNPIVKQGLDNLHPP